MFIPLKCIFSETDPDEDTYGEPIATTVDEIMINIDNICGFNSNDNGNTNIRLANGEVHEAIIHYKKFKEIILKIQEQYDYLISGAN